MKYSIILTIVSSFFLSSCCNCDEKEHKTEIVTVTETKKTTPRVSEQPNNLNISFLLDLSDRIDPKKYPNPTMDFYKRDAAYIKSVAEAFNTHLKTKKVRSLNDKIQLFFDPEPLNQEINSLSKNLKFNITKENASVELLEKIQAAYAKLPEKIYNLAITDNKYTGSNTWRFFKNKVKDYCTEANYRNILVILTDGYIYHENSKIKEGNLTSYITPQNIRAFGLTSSKWKDKLEKENFGFIPATENLSNLEVLVLGINPDNKSPFEEDVIKAYWSNWLTAMGVERFEIKNADLPANMDRLIKEFILKN